MALEIGLASKRKLSENSGAKGVEMEYTMDIWQSRLGPF